jgi:hypothetical protein
MQTTWVQDVQEDAAEEVVGRFNRENYPRPLESRYVIGLSRSGNPDEVGIYFQDPTG